MIRLFPFVSGSLLHGRGPAAAAVAGATTAAFHLLFLLTLLPVRLLYSILTAFIARPRFFVSFFSERIIAVHSLSFCMLLKSFVI